MIGLALDIGTATAKIGFIGESSPRLTTESVYLHSETQRIPHYEEDMFEKQREERLFGSSVNVWRNDVSGQRIFQEVWQEEEKQLQLQSLSLQKDGYFKFLQELVREMRELKEKHNSINEEATEYGLLVIEPAYLKKHEILKFRETLSALAFEELHLAAIYFLKSSVSVGFSEGRTNAIVVDSGHNYTSVSRVIDGYCEKSLNFNFAGNVISYELENCLRKRGVLDRTSFCSSERKGRCEVFESLCKYKELTSFKAAFAVDSSSEIEEDDVTLELSDKGTVTIGRGEILEPFTRLQDYKKATDLYFPEGYFGVARAVVDLLEEDNYNNYVDTIILTGGNTLFSNIAARISEQLTRLLENRRMGQKHILKSSTPLTSGWIGGSIAGSTEAFHNYWCTLAEYREYGVSVVNKKCPL